MIFFLLIFSTLKSQIIIDSVNIDLVTSNDKEEKFLFFVPVKINSLDPSQNFLGFPGIYVSSGSGSLGSSKISFRGFTQENTGFFLQDFALNDPFNGSIHWANLLGLSDYIVQQKFGKLAIQEPFSWNAVGGTHQYVLKKSSQDLSFTVRQNFEFYLPFAPCFSTHAQISTPIYEKIQVQVGLTYQQDQGWVQGTNSEFYAYFFSLQHQISDRQNLRFTVFGTFIQAQLRSTAVSDEVYHLTNFNQNLNYGQGKSARKDEYHKPFLFLDYDFFIQKNLTFHSSLGYSFGRGYAILTDINSKHEGLKTSTHKTLFTSLTKNGRINAPYNDHENINFSAIYAYHRGENPWTEYGIADNLNGNGLFILRASHSDHDFLTFNNSLKHQINKNWSLNHTVKLGYYYSHQYQKVYDLLGANYYLDTRYNANRPSEIPLYVGDIFANDFIFREFETGLASSLNYQYKNLTYFSQFSFANFSLQREDFFLDKNDPLQKSSWKNHQNLAWENTIFWHFLSHHAVSLQAQILTRSAYPNVLYPNSSLYKNVKNENVYAWETGYFFQQKKLKFQLIFYQTFWTNRSKAISVIDEGLTYSGFLYPLHQHHYGLEVNFSYHIFYFLTFLTQFSIGNWIYLNNLTTTLSTQTGEILTKEFNFYLKNLKIPEAPQQNLTLSLESNLGKGFVFRLDAYYFSRLYSQYNIEVYRENKPQDTWKIPNYYRLDAHLSWQSQIWKNKYSLNIATHCYNFTNNLAIVEGIDGPTHNRESSRYFYAAPISFLLAVQLFFR